MNPPISSHPHHHRGVRARVSGRLRWVTLVAAAAAGLALAAPAPASADTRGFNVCNYTSGVLVMDDATNFTGAGAGAPPNGSTVPLTECQHFEVYYIGFYTNTGIVSYSVHNRDGSVTLIALYLHVNGLGAPSTDCSASQGDTHIQLDGCPNAPAGIIFVRDAPGTVTNIPPEQSDQAAAVLQQLQPYCGGDAPQPGRPSPVDCQYSPTSETKVDSPAHQVGNALINDTDKVQRTSIKTEDTVSETNSLEGKVEVGAKIGKIIKASVSVKYGHEWTTEHTFEQEVDVECPKHQKCWIMATAPMVRDAGDVTIVVGNTTWNLRGVYFDTPDPTGNGAYTVKSQPLTSREQATASQKFTAPKRLRGTYTLPRVAQRSRIATPRLKLSIAEPSVLPAGQMSHHRIAVRRTHPRNRLVHRVRNVRVVGRVASRRAPGWGNSRRWSVRRLSPFARRSLHLRVRAPLRTRGRLCVTVKATARHARSDRARHCHRGATGRPAVAG